MNEEVVAPSLHCAVACVAALLMLVSSFALAQPAVVQGSWNGNDVEFAAGRALLSVTSDTGIAALTPLRISLSINIEKVYSSERLFAITFPESLSVISVCDPLNAQPNTHHCEPDFAVYLLTDDEYFDRQWGFRNVGGDYGGTQGADMMVEEAFAITSGDPDIKLAILDSGIPYDNSGDTLTHPDLGSAPDYSGRIVLDSICYDSSIGNPRTWKDTTGHGTRVAGIALAAANDSCIVGVCPLCTGVIEKIHHNNANQVVFTGSAMRAIWYAMARGVHVINFSYGSNNGNNPGLTQAIDSAGSEGILLLFPCGNGGIGCPNEDICCYPARLDTGRVTRPYVMAISGTDPSDNRWMLNENVESNYGNAVVAAAPAGAYADSPPDICKNILSDFHRGTATHGICDIFGRNQVVYDEGTSFAAPAVAGIAGLLLSYNTALTASDVKELIRLSADNVYGGDLPNDSIGFGRVNAFKALLRAPGVKTLQSDLTVRKHIYDEWAPYYVEGDLEIPEGVIMTIEPGARLTFGPDAIIFVFGTLIAEGEDGEVIRFEADDEENPWYGIYVEGGSAHLSYCEISGAHLPFFAQSAVGDPAVRIEDTQIHGGANGIRI